MATVGAIEEFEGAPGRIMLLAALLNAPKGDE